KDAAIRDGLHILGAAPDGEALVNLVLVILRAPQLWSARWGALPGLRAALGLVEALAATNWHTTQAPAVTSRILTPAPPAGTTPDPSSVLVAITTKTDEGSLSIAPATATPIPPAPQISQVTHV